MIGEIRGSSNNSGGDNENQMINRAQSLKEISSMLNKRMVRKSARGGRFPMSISNKNYNLSNLGMPVTKS